jgi:hypothetical protein
MTVHPRTERRKVSFVLASLLAAMAIPCMAQISIHREIFRTSEKEVKIDIELSFGTVEIARAKSGYILQADYEGPKDDRQPFEVSYDVVDGRGELTIRSKDESFWKGATRNSRADERYWHLLITDAVPLTMNIEFGAGEGTVDLTGLRIRDLQMSSGASAVDMVCTEPNAIRAKRVTIESGVSRFTARGLANLNFQRFKFSGGIGSYKLDFNGSLTESATAAVDVGLGSMLVTLPRGIPAQIEYEKNWFSSFDADDAFVETADDVFETKDFDRAEHRLTLKIQSGMGSVKIRR